MILTINEDHDLDRFRSLACYDHQKHEFPHLQVSTSLHWAHYLTKTDAAACGYQIKTNDILFKSWEGHCLVLKLLLGASYGLIIAVIIVEIQQNHIGKIFDVDYLVTLTSTMKALLYQYSSSADVFTIDSNPQLRFQPFAMKSKDWQNAIDLLWVSFKARLTFNQ